MNHRHFLTILISLVTLSSCHTYQYVYLQDTPSKSEKSPASIKDSIEVSYAFTGEGGSAVISIRNNSGSPIIVDKSKSNLIKGEQTIPFWENKSQISAVTTTRPSYINEDDYYTDTRGQIIKNEMMLFIPPASKGVLNGPKAQTQFLEPYPGGELTKISIPTDNGTFTGEQISFPDSNSPYKYRVFLTISKYGTDENPFFIDKSFNATTITNTSVKPEYFNKNGNRQFYIKKQTGFGTFLGGVAGLGALIILAVSQE